MNGATVFRQGHVRLFLFPNSHGRMHPNLAFDLLGAQVAALKKRKISVLAYFMLTWNPELAERHPESHEEKKQVDQKSQRKHGFWYRLVHNRWFWIVVLGFVLICGVLAWLYASYVPPFPPNWVGVDYYSYTITQPVNFNDISILQQQLKTVETAVLIFEPSTPDAARLLPHGVVAYTYNLSDPQVIRISVENALANDLSGINVSDEQLATQMLQDPASYLKLTKVLVAVTRVDNFNPGQALFAEKLASTGKEIPHEEYDAALNELQLAPSISPLQVTPQNSNDVAAVTIQKPGAFRIYADEASKTASVGATLLLPYDSFIQVNDKLVPTKSGRSSWVILHPGNYQLPKGSSIVPITFHLAVHTLNGIPYARTGLGHGWTSLSFEENGVFYPLMTASLFNSLDTDNAPNTDAAELTNIATYTNLWINHPDDWVRATRSLNRIPLTDGPSRTRVNAISPEKARDILLLRAWYLPQYSTQEYYMKYLQDSFAATSSIKDKVTLAIEMGHIQLENILNQTFWGTIQVVMNNTLRDTRYNGITSNCVAYSTAFWNNEGGNPYYDPRMLHIIAVPGKLYHIMNPDQVITLPDANTLPPWKRNVPYTGSP